MPDRHHLSQYMGGLDVITCANGTDALQIALMALGLKPGDEVIVPAFTYVSSAEVIALLGLTPVMVDVDPDTFNVTAENIRKALTPASKAVIPVHGADTGSRRRVRTVCHRGQCPSFRGRIHIQRRTQGQDRNHGNYRMHFILPFEKSRLLWRRWRDLLLR